MSSVNFAIPDFCSLIPVGSLGLSRRVRNRRVTHRPWLVMGSRLVERKFQNCFRLAGKPEVRKVVQHNWDRLTSSDSRACEIRSGLTTEPTRDFCPRLSPHRGLFARL